MASIVLPLEFEDLVSFEVVYHADLVNERLFIEGEFQFQQFDQVEVAITIHEEGLGFMLKGEVVHVLDECAAQKLGMKAGVGLFVPLKPDQRERLDAYLQHRVASSADDKEPPEVVLDERLTDQVTSMTAELEMRFRGANHYDVLAILPNATSTDVIRAYRKLVKSVHPDQYFDRIPSEVMGRLEFIYQRVSDAFHALIDIPTRIEYDIEHNNYCDVAEAGLTARDKRLAQLKARQNTEQPEGTDRGRNLYESAVKALKQGNIPVARNQLRLALTFDPFNSLYRQKLEELG